jgi:hypothetical protein
MELLKNPEIRALVMYNIEMVFIAETLFCIYPLFAFTSIESGAFLFSRYGLGDSEYLALPTHQVVSASTNPR